MENVVLCSVLPVNIRTSIQTVDLTGTLCAECWLWRTLPLGECLKKPGNPSVVDAFLFVPISIVARICQRGLKQAMSSKIPCGTGELGVLHLLLAALMRRCSNGRHGRGNGQRALRHLLLPSSVEFYERVGKGLVTGDFRTARHLGIRMS